MDEKELDQLLEYQPADVYVWIHRVWEGFEQEPEHFNWLGLAEGAALYARRDKQGVPRPDLVWAEVAIMLYHYLTKQAPNRYRRISLECSMMRLRAYLIQRLGVTPNHLILAVDDMIEWFFKYLRFSCNEALQKSAYYRSLKREERLALGKAEREEWLELRLVKEKLSLFEHLESITSLNEDLLRWLSMREQLL